MSANLLKRRFGFTRVCHSEITTRVLNASASTSTSTSTSTLSPSSSSTSSSTFDDSPFSTINDISSNLRETPTSTGAGPFIEFPKFNPLGLNSSLLNVTLPPSAILNLRNNSILAANGDVKNISSRLSVLNLFSKQPLLFNQVSSTTPISLILSNRNTNDSFITLELSDTDHWNVLSSKSLVAWYGENLDIQSDKVGLRVKSNDSRSNLILSGNGQLFTLSLDESERILLKPSSIVGFTSRASDPAAAAAAAAFQRFKTSNLDIEIPQLGFIDSVIPFFKACLKFFDRSVKPLCCSVWKRISDSYCYQTIKQKFVELTTPTYELCKKVYDEVCEFPLSFFKNKRSKHVGNAKDLTLIDKSIVQLRKFNDWIKVKYNNFRMRNSLFYEIKGPATIIIQNQHSHYSKLFTNDQLSFIYKQLKK